MARITASRPIGRIRGKDEVSMGRTRDKDEVSESRKPKKRGSKPNGPTWQE